MQALESAISRKMPGSPASRTKCEEMLTSDSVTDARTGMRRSNDTVPPQMRVWIDLTNSPHVLVMRPVIERLRAKGHEVQVTARDFAQTLALCERFGIDHTAIGRHRGERLSAKATGLLALHRAGALGAPPAFRHRARPWL